MRSYNQWHNCEEPTDNFWTFLKALPAGDGGGGRERKEATRRNETKWKSPNWDRGALPASCMCTLNNHTAVLLHCAVLLWFIFARVHIEIKRCCCCIVFAYICHYRGKWKLKSQIKIQRCHQQVIFLLVLTELKRVKLRLRETPIYGCCTVLQEWKKWKWH